LFNHGRSFDLKRTIATPLFACLLAAVSTSPQALAGTEAYGPPAATLRVGQIPRIGDDVMTPLPDDSALPSDPAKAADVPPVAGAMPVAHVEVHDLTPQGPASMDKTAAPVVADAMPPNPSPIKNAREPASVKTAAMGPVEDSLVPAQTHGPSSLPFPPSAQDWAARMPLGSTMKIASAAPPAAGRDDMSATFAKPKMIHVGSRADELAPSQMPPALSLETETAMQSPPVPAPGPPIVHHSALRNYAMNHAPPAHIVVQSAPPPSSECRDYTRTLKGSHGRQAAGTACLGGDGVWRIAEEHLLPQVRHVSARMVSPPAYYYPAPVQAYQPAYIIAGYGYGYGRGWRHWR
jgi:hypothetical protein